MASASRTTCAPPTKRSSSSPATHPAGEPVAGRPPGQLRHRRPCRPATSTRLPYRRPRSTAASPIRHGPGSTERTVATCPRACRSGGPSARFARYQPAGREHPGHLGGVLHGGQVGRGAGTGEDVGDHHVVRGVAGGRPARPARPRPGPAAGSRPARAAPGGPAPPARRPPRTPAAWTRAGWPDTYRGRVSAPPPRCSTRSGAPDGRDQVQCGGQPPDVLELQMGRVGQVDVRLRRAVQQQRPRAGPVRRPAPARPARCPPARPPGRPLVDGPSAPRTPVSGRRGPRRSARGAAAGRRRAAPAADAPGRRSAPGSAGPAGPCTAWRRTGAG